MSEIHNLNNYAYAKEMVEIIPKALGDLEKARVMLYEHRGFVAISETIFTIEGAILALEPMPYHNKKKES